MEHGTVIVNGYEYEAQRYSASSTAIRYRKSENGVWLGSTNRKVVESFSTLGCEVESITAEWVCTECNWQTFSHSLIADHEGNWHGHRSTVVNRNDYVGLSYY